MTYEIDERTAESLRCIVRAWHKNITDWKRHCLGDATGRQEIAKLEADIAFFDSLRDDVLKALKK